MATTKQELLKQFEQNYETYIDSFSGATGGVLATVLLYPFENYRTRIQTANKESSEDKNSDKEEIK